MTAKFINVGEPAHDAERQALRFLVEGLPDDYSVYGNPWLVERTGSMLELDAVITSPHAVYIVEIKSFRGRIEGTDSDWYIPHPIKSPIRLNRLTAQKLKDQLKRVSYDAGLPWVQGFVFLSATTNVGVRGPASDHCIWTRKNSLAALQDEDPLERLSGRAQPANTQAADAALLELFTGDKRGKQPARQIREYDLLARLDHQETYAELLAQNRIDGTKRVLRVYAASDFATDEQREAIDKRAR